MKLAHPSIIKLCHVSSYLRNRKTSPKSCPRRFASAFTLVELMLVVVIVGIFAALVVPYAGSASDSRLPAAMRILQADLAYAQTHSISKQNDPCIVVFALDNSGYHLALTSTPDTPLIHPGDHQPYKITWGQGRAASLTGVRIKTLIVGDDNQLAFGSLGQLDQTTPATITLTDGKHDMAITLDPITANATITTP